MGAGELEDAEEVFFLEKDELFSALAATGKGEAVTSLHDRAVGRKQMWERQRKLAAPDRLPAEVTVEGLDITPQLVQDGRGSRIIAQAASPGVGRGRARVVHSLDEVARFSKGDILVTVAASPAFTPFVLLAAGVVTEAGGGASHSTLVARELGVPAVVNAGVATQVIRDGQMLEVDGTRGIVTLLD